MKKKVIAVIMTAAIVMGMAACGGKDAGAENTNEGSSVETTQESTVTEESPAQDGSAAVGDQASAEDSADSSTEASEPSGEGTDPSAEAGTESADGSEAADASAETEGFDWDSVDWEGTCLTMSTGKQSKTKSLIMLASFAQFRGFTPEEAIAFRYETDDEEVLAERGTATYDDLTEEGRLVLDELFKLSMDELNVLDQKYNSHE